MHDFMPCLRTMVGKRYFVQRGFMQWRNVFGNVHHRVELENAKSNEGWRLGPPQG